MAPASLLNLPAEVRMSIYRNMGLVRPYLINLSLEIFKAGLRNDRPTQDCGYYDAIIDDLEDDGSESAVIVMKENRVICNHEVVPIALLSVNRQVRHEAAQVLFGENKFHVNFQDIKAVEILRNFPSLTWECLAELHLTLDDIVYYGEARWLGSFANYKHEWIDVCKFLGEHLRPGITRLCVALEGRNLA